MTRPLGSAKKTTTMKDRFWMKVDKKSPKDCWPWLGAKLPAGYGQIGGPGKIPVLAHRYSYELHNSINPKGLHVCHTCDNPPCVNPKHLFLGTRKDNMKDCVKKGRHAQKSKTHCKLGHPLSGDNLSQCRNGGRRCRICSNRQARERYPRYEKRRKS